MEVKNRRCKLLLINSRRDCIETDDDAKSGYMIAKVPIRLMRPLRLFKIAKLFRIIKVRQSVSKTVSE